MQKIRRKDYQGDIVRIFLNRLPVLGKGFGLFFTIIFSLDLKLTPLIKFGRYIPVLFSQAQIRKTL